MEMKIMISDEVDYRHGMMMVIIKKMIVVREMVYQDEDEHDYRDAEDKIIKVMITKEIWMISICLTSE